MNDRDAGDIADPRLTLHLVAESVWWAQRGNLAHHPEQFSTDGFVQCLDGEDLAIDVANRYYRDDRRPFQILDVNLNQVAAPVLLEDSERRYPHVYGPIERRAVVRVRRLAPSEGGAFVAIGETLP